VFGLKALQQGKLHDYLQQLSLNDKLLLKEAKKND